MVKLLAADAKKPGSLGFTLHRVGKKFMRWAVNWLAEHTLKDVIQFKKKRGWVNEEVRILYTDLNEIVKRNERAWNTPDNRDRRFFYNIRDLICTMLDEDSYYLLRFYYFLELTFEHEKEYHLEMHKSRAYWRWEEIIAALRRERERDKEMVLLDNEKVREDVIKNTRSNNRNRSS